MSIFNLENARTALRQFKTEDEKAMLFCELTEKLFSQVENVSKLEQQLKEALEVIDFYSNGYSTGVLYDFEYIQSGASRESGFSEGGIAYGVKAREFLKKWSEK